MNERGIEELLSCVQPCDVTIGDQWVNSTCPLASVSHEKGIDRHPSFGVLINNKGESLYRCFTCSDPAPLSGLIHNLWVLDINGWQGAMKVYGENEIFNSGSKSMAPLSKWDAVVDKKASKAEVPAVILDQFPLLYNARGYEAQRCSSFLAAERGIDKEVQNLFRLRYSDGGRLIIFPRENKENKVYWLRARSRMAKAFFSISCSYAKKELGDVAPYEWGDSSYLFGEHLLTEEPVIIVESETDVLRLYSLGVRNVVATGGGVQKAQLDRLYHSVVILGFDADVPGLKNKIKAEKHLKGYSTLFYLDWRVAGVKDAGELKSRADFDKVYNKKSLL